MLCITHTTTCFDPRGQPPRTESSTANIQQKTETHKQCHVVPARCRDVPLVRIKPNAPFLNHFRHCQLFSSWKRKKKMTFTASKSNTMAAGTLTEPMLIHHDAAKADPQLHSTLLMQYSRGTQQLYANNGSVSCGNLAASQTGPDSPHLTKSMGYTLPLGSSFSLP